MNRGSTECRYETLKNIDELKVRIVKHKEEYSKNEWLVRYSLIDPFLRLLGSDLENPQEGVPELSNDAGRPDYTLFKNNKKLAFVGTKKLDTREDIKQHLQYNNIESVRCFITTYGDSWSIYRNSFYLKPVDKSKTMEYLNNEINGIGDFND